MKTLKVNMKYLKSNKNIFGMSASALIAFLAIFGIIGAYTIPLVVAAYVLGYLIAPQEKLEQPIIIMTSEEKMDKVLQSLAFQINEMGKNIKMESEFLKKIEAFKKTSLHLVDYLQQSNNDDINNQNLFQVRKMIEEYVPNLINVFKTLPEDFWYYKKDGKNYAQKLNEQMQLINDAMKDISLAYYENNMKSVEIQNTLLKDKFEKGIELEDFSH